MKTQIIYEDKDLIVCFKPAGLAVQSGRASEPDMVSELKNHLAKGGQAAGAGGNARPSGKKPVYLGVIHRLDQPVSGILVFAKNQRAAASLSGQAADHVMQKTYRAVVLASESGDCTGNADGSVHTDDGVRVNGSVTDGWLSGGAPETGVHELTDYLVKEPGGGARIAGAKEKDAKCAQLFYRCVAKKENRALLEIDLKTGRHHQIRVQLAHAGMPLLGDNRYGTKESRRLSQQLEVRNIQLQAVRLKLVHPATGKQVCFELEQKLGL